jgi:Na+-driven multidrug efflux pump
MGESLIPMIMAVVGICGFRILWAGTVFQLPAFHTPEVLYLVYPISWTLTGISQGIAFMIIYRKFKGDSDL